MSRTYRIRRLPRFGVKNYTDSRAGWSFDRSYDYYEDLLQKNFGDLELNFYFKHEMINHLKRQHPTPASSFLSHPWVCWSCVGRVKKWYRVNGNRWGRRTSRSFIKKMSYDYDYDDRRKFPNRRQEMWDIWSVT